MNEIHVVINRLIKRIIDSMCVSLSDLYTKLDLQSSILSDKIDWRLNVGLIETSFSDVIVKN